MNMRGMSLVRHAFLQFKVGSYQLCQKINMPLNENWHTHAAQTGERFHGLKHPEKAYRNAKKYFPLNQIEVDIIRTHMWPVTFRTFPRTREGWVTTLTDKYCSLLETGRRK